MLKYVLVSAKKSDDNEPEKETEVVKAINSSMFLVSTVVTESSFLVASVFVKCKKNCFNTFIVHEQTHKIINIDLGNTTGFRLCKIPDITFKLVW